LKEIFWRASVEAKRREEAMRRRTELQWRQKEQRQRREDLRALFHQVFEAARSGLADLTATALIA
jgi:hypothetical protein